MQEQRTTQIPEVAHNQAILTLIAERQELIRSREHIQNLEKALEEGREINEKLKHSLVIAEEERITSDSRQHETAGDLEDTQKLLEEATAKIEELTQEPVESPDKSSRIGEWKIENADELGKKGDCVMKHNLIATSDEEQQD